LKITFIISSLSSGGAERVLSNLANKLSIKHNINIIIFSNNNTFYYLDGNINLIKLDLLKNSKSKFESIKNTIKRIIILRKTLKNIDSDINISFMTHTNILSVIASKLNNQKVIIAERIVYNFYQSKVLNLLRILIYPKANYLVTQTLDDKKNYNFMKNVEVIYNPLQLPELKKKRENIILAVGRLDKQKGFSKLIDIFSKINSNGWKLCIAGDGVEKNSLQEQIKRLKLNNIELIGKRKDIFDWYAKASIFILSSQKEGFPNVLLEAMGSGCACISFDCPSGPGEIIDNEINGILVENQNLEQLSFQIQRLLDDEKLRDRLSKEALKVREKYDIELIANQWEEIIKKVISK
jgi:GalNAc-alpha-(1->4)-GalNAc-alpha-(1->3)-diNAcBac-PP-undecaprenol alpha-1,4-N-acetyl-D-galactosaminyltransferase